MSKFALEEIDSIRGKQIFSKLIMDGICLFDEFASKLEEQYKSELDAIGYYMEAVANLQSLPDTKFRELKGGKGDVKEYEFKSRHFRVYVMQQKGGKIIVIGGYKNNQSKDILSFRSIKKQFLDSFKDIKS